MLAASKNVPINSSTTAAMKDGFEASSSEKPFFFDAFFTVVFTTFSIFETSVTAFFVRAGFEDFFELAFFDAIFPP